jgi:hypothetical protein
MSEHQIEERWVTGDSVARLTFMLGLPSHPYMQDWEYECADSNRLREFLDLYEGGGLSDDDQFALMALVVSSFDDWLGGGNADNIVLHRIRRHLLADFSLHERTIHYWCLLDEADLDNVFHVTPFMREIWSHRR